MKTKLPLTILSLLIFATTIIAQPRSAVPTLTTDDVIVTRPVTPTPPPATVTSTPEKNVAKVATTEEKKLGKIDAKTETAKTATDPAKVAEKDWNAKLGQAQEKVSGLERQADQSELEIARLRNQLFSADAKLPEARGQLVTQMGELMAQMNKLRTAAKIAQKDVATLIADGKANNYKTEDPAQGGEKGDSDPQAKQKAEQKLKTELSDAQARIEILQLRLNSNHAETLRKGSGDNFTLNRLREEKENILTDLESTRAKLADLHNKLKNNQGSHLPLD